MENEFGRRLVVPESYIYKLGEDYVEPNCKTFVWENEKRKSIIGVQNSNISLI